MARKGKKKVYRKRRQRKAYTGSARNKPLDGLPSGSTVVTFPRTMTQAWPEVLRGTFTFVDNEIIAGNVTSYKTLTYKMNSLHSMGPQVNFTGSFGTTSVTGASYLLSTILSTGSNAPYGRYRIVSSRVRVQYIHYSDGSGTPTSSPIRFSVWPSTEGTFSSMAQNVVQSQPYVKNMLVPSISTSNKPPTLYNYMTPNRLLGFDLEAYRSGLEYSSVYGQDPSITTYWHVYLDRVDANHPLDGGSVQFRNEVTIEFYDLNPLVQTNL